MTHYAFLVEQWDRDVRMGVTVHEDMPGVTVKVRELTAEGGWTPALPTDTAAVVAFDREDTHVTVLALPMGGAE